MKFDTKKNHCYNSIKKGKKNLLIIYRPYCIHFGGFYAWRIYLLSIYILTMMR